MGKGTKITSVFAREVFTDRGHPGIESIVITESSATGVAVSTSGTSRGKYEAKFALDGGTRWNGLGVSKAVNNVNNIIAVAIKGMDSTKQLEIDDVILKLDGTLDKSRLGANATGSVSAAVLKAGTASLGIPLYQHIGGINACMLPVPGITVMVGSGRYGADKRAGGKPSYSIMCYGFNTFHEATYASWEIYTEFKKNIVKKFNLDIPANNYITIPPGQIKHDREFIKIISEAISDLGYENRAGIQADVAAGTYYDKNKHKYIGLFSADEKSKNDLTELYKELVKTYPFVIIEDPLEEDDFGGHAYLKKELGVEIVGDDLFATNIERVKRGIDTDAAHSVLLKVYQIGTISEAFEMVQFAYNHGMGIMPCGSRGEGADIADYAVGLGAGQIRESALGPEGNRLLKIESELGSRAKFLGKAAVKGFKR
ncbi:Enolase [subsurface metagenome]|jgi:enolase